MRIAAAILVCLVAMPARAGDVARVVSYDIVDGRSIPESLTGAPGDAEAGRQLYFDLELTGCSGCHGSPGGPGAQRDADAPPAPSLEEVGDRLDPGQLRLWLVAPGLLSPGTGMPAYYTVGQRRDQNDPFYGQTRLSAAEIEDLVAYLAQQRAP